MNWLKKGPELKLSELKVPDFLYDLFYDLKDRHLLPLVAVLIVAMVGAPIYFNSTHESEVEPSAPLPPATASTVAAGGPSGTITVARSEPGLRDYRRRLKNYRALDPFRQQGGQSTTAAEAPAEEASSSTPVAPVEATVIAEEATPPAPEPSYEAPPYEPAGPPVSEPGSTPNPGTTVRTRYVSSAIDVRVVTVPPPSTEQERSKRPKAKAEVRRNLPELTMLPARKTPAATYIGLSNDGKKALFVVSSDVVSIFGEAKCLVGSQSCQLLMLEPQMPVTFVYGPQERTYRIELLKIDRTYSAKPRRAALGKTAGGHRSKAGEGEGPSGKEPAERGNG
jgi:hypothetical protein